MPLRRAILLVFFAAGCSDPVVDTTDAIGSNDAAALMDAGFGRDAEIADLTSQPDVALDGSFEDLGVPDLGAAEDASSLDASEIADAGAADATEPLDATAADFGTADAGTSGAIAALYPTAIGWNDYVRADGPDVLSATGAPCAAMTDGPYWTACIHAGEMRAFEVPGRNSCSGLTARDDLGAFEWRCDDRTMPVRMVSLRLADGRRLTDLIDWSASPVGWRQNRVRVLDGAQEIHQTQPEIWWPNQVVTSTAAGTYVGTTLSPRGVLNAAGTIYAITVSSTGTYQIIADRVGLVMAPGVRVHSSVQHPPVRADRSSFGWIEGQASATRNNGLILGDTRFTVVSDFEVVRATGNGIWVGGRKSYLRRLRVRDIPDGPFYTGLFVWLVEGNIIDGLVAENTPSGIHLNDARNNIIRNAVLNRNRRESILIRGNSFQNTIADVRANGSQFSYGVLIDTGAHRNRLIRVTTINNRESGFLLRSDGNLLFDVATSNNGRMGVEVVGDDNRIIGASSMANAFRAFSITNNRGLAMIGATALHTASNEGVWLQNVRDATLAGVVAINAAGTNGGGVFADGQAASPTVERLHFLDLASAHHGTYGVNLDYAHESRFDGLLLLGGNTTADCLVTGGTNPALMVGGGGCDVQGASTAAVTRGVDLSTSLVGRVTTDEPVSPDDTNGTAARAAITDWTALVSHRLWGRDGASLIDPMARGVCATGQTCRVWDLAVRANDTMLRNRLALPSGNDVAVHTWSAADATACALIPSGATWTGTACQSTFLLHAVEIADDGIGDDDGLCESGETCLHLPNIGAYEGEGALVSAGTFTDGTISQVTLLQYATNGR
jgi:hypothetical protein